MILALFSASNAISSALSALIMTFALNVIHLFGEHLLMEYVLAKWATGTRTRITQILHVNLAITVVNTVHQIHNALDVIV